MAESSLDLNHVTACSDQTGGGEVPQIMQSHTCHTCSPARPAPAVADAVLMHGPAALAEQPLLVAGGADLVDVVGDEVDQAVGEVDYSF